jgi:D-serine dehydratase
MNGPRHIKGLPHREGDIERSDIASRNWNVLAEDLPLPVAVLRRSALDNNRRWMREFLARTGARLAPHGKTTMSPQLFAMQIEDGAWAITLATVHQVRVARAAGIHRILLTNEIVGDPDISYLLDEMKRDPAFEFLCLVDSHEGLACWVRAASTRRVGRPVRLLIEMGHAGGRAGCRDIESAVSLARAIKGAEPYVQLEGVEGFEGLHPPDSDAPVKAFVERIATAAQRIDAESLFGAQEIILTAGGSAYYDIVVGVFDKVNLSRPKSVILRSGCYLTHDTGIYDRSFHDVRRRSETAREIRGGFENALEVWAYVVSVPESQRAILGAGRRDFGHDSGLPVPVRRFRPGSNGGPTTPPPDWQLVAVNDQHAHLTFPAGADIRVGDLIALGPSHPCTTFDKWQLIHVVEDDYRVSAAIRTFF